VSAAVGFPLRPNPGYSGGRPEFHDNVLIVETHDLVRKPENSPRSGHGHYEFGNAEMCYLVGDALNERIRKVLTATHG
jgi:hypothetical protein